MHGVCREGENCQYSHDLKDKPSMVCNMSTVADSEFLLTLSRLGFFFCLLGQGE